MFNIPMNSKQPMSLSDMANMGSNQGGFGATNQGGFVNNQGGFNATNQNNFNANTNQGGFGANQGVANQNNFNNTASTNNFVNTQQSQPVQTTQRPPVTGVVLKKGQKVALAGSNGGALTNIQVCLGWDVKNVACDLDASAFMLGADGKVVGDEWFVFYGQTISPDGSVRHSGDSTNGAAMGDDEVIDINLQTINPNVKKITFVVTINEALEHGLNFSMVANAYVRVVDKSTGQEINRFQLTDYYANVTSMVVGEVYNHNGQWKFNAVGDGVARDLAGLCDMYGVNVVG